MISKKDCSGCGACAQSCPFKCISMQSDSEGFFYPVIDKELCKSCGICDNVCPIPKSRQNKKDCITSYIGYSSSDKRMSSSSGGVFSLLAEKTIKECGAVFGAAWDENMQVHHIAVESLEDLQKLRCSKYVQSKTEDTYLQAKSMLQNGRKVLYSGTGCQIAGLKAFLNKEYDNLLTVEVLCHGVPSPKVWSRYLSEKEDKYQSSAVDVVFRRKLDYSWEKYAVQISFENGGNFVKPSEENRYMKLFLNNICLRPACHNCQFKGIKRQSDIVLGDAWGIDKYAPEMNDKKGTSSILIFTEKGQKEFDSISSKMCLKREAAETVLPVTSDARKPVLPHKARKKFFKKLNKGVSTAQLCELLKPSLITRVKYKLRIIK